MDILLTCEIDYYIDMYYKLTIQICHSNNIRSVIYL